MEGDHHLPVRLGRRESFGTLPAGGGKEAVVDVLDETREKLGAMLGSDGEFYIGVDSGGDAGPHYRGPLPAVHLIETALTWARGAFAGTEATIATRNGDDYPVTATLTAGGPGEAPKLAGSRGKRSGTKEPEAKPAPEVEAKPVKAPSTTKKKATARRKPTSS
jgi:hypothetical protein